MTKSVKTQEEGLGRAAGRCSNPDCCEELFEDETEYEQPKGFLMLAWKRLTLSGTSVCNSSLLMS